MTEHTEHIPGVTDNPFADDWRDCLKAHYEHVITAGDRLNQESLHQVLLTMGFEAQSLQEITVALGGEIPLEMSAEIAEVAEIEAIEPTFEFVTDAIPVTEAVLEVASEVQPEPSADFSADPAPDAPEVPLSLFSDLDIKPAPHKPAAKAPKGKKSKPGQQQPLF